MTDYYIGIDPGITGAIAVLDSNAKFVTLIDMPVMAKGKGHSKIKNQVNPVALYESLAPYKSSIALLEQVNAMPAQGVSSMFSLGDTFGSIRSVLATLYIPVELVSPQTWKKFYKLPADKEIARAKAIQLFPEASLHRKKDSDRAEALLMAKYLIDIKK